ncbi:MAG: HAMP domain-containing protein, partial [Microcoleus sp. SIO2G3]|nr:HAMP domain-containing protein [Microcoleus sp. SIO2G3]
MAESGLRSRLFLSHLIVLLVGLVPLVIIGKVFAPRFFEVYLLQIEGRGVFLRQYRAPLVRGFNTAWARGSLWAVVGGASAAAGVSYWLTQRIVQPIEQMEEITQKFAAGRMDERMAPQTIEEFDHLAVSFNRMAASIENVEQRRRDLVSDLTHELRTPLTVLGGYLEGLSDGAIEPSPELHERLLNETMRMRRLVDDLQELSKMEAGYLAIDAQPIDLRPLLTNLVQRFSDQLLDESSPILKLNYPASVPFVLADAERVEQILVNLIGNAIRYTPSGSIVVSVKPDGNQVWIEVRDTGVGIAAEDLPHVFERFWRADRSRNRTSGGTGIGLA